MAYNNISNTRECPICNAIFCKRADQVFCSVECGRKNVVMDGLKRRISLTNKKCPICKLVKPIEEFALKNPRKPFSRAAYCKPCHKTYYRDVYYAKNKERECRAVKRRKYAQIAWMKDLKSGLKCSSCPESHPATLHFHHRDKGTKDFVVSMAVNRGLSREKILAEISKCDVLCANCHAKFHYVGL